MKQTPVFAGIIRLNHSVDVTDPCFDRQVKCRKTVDNLLPGIYRCYWQVCRSRNISIYVQGLWIVHERAVGAPCSIPPGGQWDELGLIGVDSGLAGFFDCKPDLRGDAWDDFIAYMDRQDKACGSEPRGYLRKLDGRDGFWAPSGGGDGAYPVYAHRSGSQQVDGLFLWFNEKD